MMLGLFSSSSLVSWEVRMEKYGERYIYISHNYAIIFHKTQIYQRLLELNVLRGDDSTELAFRVSYSD